MSAVLCPAGHVASLVNGRGVYSQRPDLYDKSYWLCRPCRAWVGCHPGTTRPLGTLAGPRVRRARQEAHAAFDLVWQSGRRKRKRAYAELAAFLGIEVERCHIGSFDVETCARVEQFADKVLGGEA